MAMAAKKQMIDAAARAKDRADTLRSAEVIGDVERVLITGAAMSPARLLQARLHAHFSPVATKMSVQFITLVIMFTCVGTWIAGMGLSTGPVAI